MIPLYLGVKHLNRNLTNQYEKCYNSFGTKEQRIKEREEQKT